MVPRSHCRPAGEPDGGYAGLGFPEPELGDGLVAAHENTVHAVGPSGSVLVLDCRVWHCAPPNRSDAEVRTPYRSHTECLSIYPRTDDRLLQRVMVNVRYCPASLLSRSGAGTRVGSGVATAQFSPRDSMSREHLNALPVRSRAPLSPLAARCVAWL